MKIISGGQTGVDRAALDAALSLGVVCGGWCPAGRLDENGIIPAHYPLQELPGGGYVERTARNVSETDGTAIFHTGPLQGGTKATADFCTHHGKPCLLIDASRLAPTEGAQQLKEFVQAHRIEVLNVAGPRASQWPQGYDFTLRLLNEFLIADTGGAARPKLSFVVPAHNEEHELPETLRAIRRAADSAKESYELIVVDDASTDSTAAIAQQFGARIVPVNRRQIAAVRNAGARESRGEILFFVDADTQIAPGHVASRFASAFSRPSTLRLGLAQARSFSPDANYSKGSVALTNNISPGRKSISALRSRSWGASKSCANRSLPPGASCACTQRASLSRRFSISF
jgi:hypothetical protein